MRVAQRLRDLGVLTRLRVTSNVTLSAAAGYFVMRERPPGDAEWTADLWRLLAPAAGGVFLLACGASALNQVQEARFDAVMVRTRDRPIPAGRLDPAVAAFVGGLLVLLGAYVLALIDRHTLTILAVGAGSIVWYNGVYTPLKRVTAFAVVPGALVGVVPPTIGWLAAGGDPLDGRLLIVAGFFFVWQIPHFWLLLLGYADDYERAGLPTLGRHFDDGQIRRVTCVWLLATAGVGLLLLPVLDVALPWSLALVIATGWLAVEALALLGPALDARRRRRLFAGLILYGVVVTACLSLDAVRVGLLTS